MTAANHANTVREILDAEGTFIYRRDEFLAALDALQTQARELEAIAQFLDESGSPQENEHGSALNTLERVQALLTQAETAAEWERRCKLEYEVRQDTKRMMEAAEAERDRLQRDQWYEVGEMRHRAEAAEAERDHAREALDAIERELGTVPLDQLSLDAELAVSKAWAMAREKRPDPELIPAPIARAALGDEP